MTCGAPLTAHKGFIVKQIQSARRARLAHMKHLAHEFSPLLLGVVALIVANSPAKDWHQYYFGAAHGDKHGVSHLAVEKVVSGSESQPFSSPIEPGSDQPPADAAHGHRGIFLMTIRLRFSITALHHWWAPNYLELSDQRCFYGFFLWHCRGGNCYGLYARGSLNPLRKAMNPLFSPSVGYLVQL